MGIFRLTILPIFSQMYFMTQNITDDRNGNLCLLITKNYLFFIYKQVANLVSLYTLQMGRVIKINSSII